MENRLWLLQNVNGASEELEPCLAHWVPNPGGVNVLSPRKKSARWISTTACLLLPTVPHCMEHGLHSQVSRQYYRPYHFALHEAHSSGGTAAGSSSSLVN